MPEGWVREGGREGGREGREGRKEVIHRLHASLGIEIAGVPPLSKHANTLQKAETLAGGSDAANRQLTAVRGSLPHVIEETGGTRQTAATDRDLQTATAQTALTLS